MLRLRILFPSSVVVFFALLVTFFLVAFVPASVEGQGATTMAMDDGLLSPEEIALVAKFRVIVKNIIYKDWMQSDEYLVRWLRIRDHNLQAARDALQLALDWRKSNDIDHVLEEDFSDLENEFKVIFDGHDKGGRPLVIISIGSIDVRKVVLSGRGDRIIRVFAQLMEVAQTVLRDMNAAEGSSAKNHTGSFYILDLAGFNLRQHACVRCIPTGLSLFPMYENYYPDMAYKVFAVNTPRAFLPLYELIRPFFSEPSRRAVQLFDNDSDRWKQALLEYVDLDQLPKLYGGTKIVHSKTISALRKSNPYIKAVFDRAAAEKLKRTKTAEV